MRIRLSYSSICKVLGQLLIVEGLLLVIPLIMECVEGEDNIYGFLTAFAASCLTGICLYYPNRHKRLVIGRREGSFLVSVAWILFAMIGMIPFMTSRNPLSVTDAFFETISGFTTTGATVIADVESLSRGLVLWRAMTQWLGGLGIILFILAIMPWLNEKGGVPMYNAEVTGITHDKLHPRIRQTASALWLVYGLLTMVLIIMLWLGPMDLFDSVCQAFATISTGGFSSRNAGISFWDSDYVNMTLIVFMFIGGINFSLLHGALHGDLKSMWRNDVLRFYTFVVLISYGAVALSVCPAMADTGFHQVFVEPMFHVVSAITTTGFALSDYGQWGPFAIVFTFMLMTCGACAGSTSGAMKCDRILALGRNMRNEITATIFPKRVYTVRICGNVLSAKEMERITAFATIYCSLIVAGSLVVSAFGISIDDSFFAVVSCIGNNGLGYGITGVSGGFHLLPDVVKWMLSLLMITGRLELFSMLVLTIPAFWRK